MYKHIDSRIDQGVLVLTVKDRELREEQVAFALRDEFLDAFEKCGTDKVVVDLSSLTYVSSVAFRPLLSLRRAVGDKQGRMVLCGLSELVEEIFRVTRLLISGRPSHSTFEDQPNVAAAIAYLNGAAV